MNTFFAFIDRLGDRLTSLSENNYQKHRISYQIIFYLLIGIGLFVVLNAVILGDEKNGLWLFVYKFQTLITGIFAIIAALITVRTMRITDERQELRHRELISLNLRRDRMRVRRAADPQLDLIAWHKRNLGYRIEQFNQDTEYQLTKIISSEFANYLIAECKAIQGLIARKQIKEVKPLISPEGFSSIQDLNGFLDRAILDLGILVEFNRDLLDSLDWIPLPYNMKAKTIEVRECLISSQYQLSLLEAAIQELFNEYEAL